MNPVRTIKSVIRFGFNRIVIPAFVAALALGAISGPHGASAHMTPQPQVVAQELQAHHDLPKGTTLTLGDPKRPLTIMYDKHGSLLVTPPKGETFGTILARGFSQMGALAHTSGSPLTPPGDVVASADASTRTATQ